jgi:hypothetical protein
MYLFIPGPLPHTNVQRNSYGAHILYNGIVLHKRITTYICQHVRTEAGENMYHKQLYIP